MYLLIYEEKRLYIHEVGIGPREGNVIETGGR